MHEGTFTAQSLPPPQPAECPHFLHGSPGNEMGQFGASLSTTPDLSGDGFPEVAVGAPLEDEGRGALYLFLSRPGGLEKKHSQVCGHLPPLLSDSRPSGSRCPNIQIDT